MHAAEECTPSVNCRGRSVRQLARVVTSARHSSRTLQPQTQPCLAPQTSAYPWLVRLQLITAIMVRRCLSFLIRLLPCSRIEELAADLLIGMLWAALRHGDELLPLLVSGSVCLSTPTPIHTDRRYAGDRNMWPSQKLALNASILPCVSDFHKSIITICIMHISVRLCKAGWGRRLERQRNKFLSNHYCRAKKKIIITTCRLLI